MELHLNTEEFGEQNPAINPDLFVEHSRVALSEYHESPAGFTVHIETENYPAKIVFAEPDPRSQNSLQRPDFIEKGAIVIAGLLLNSVEKKQLTRVVPRGTNVDYFAGEEPGDYRWILEVGGTDAQRLSSVRQEKTSQLQASYYRRPPHSKAGFVSVTRFAAPRGESTLDYISAE